jgi:hypothetical protein
MCHGGDGVWLGGGHENGSLRFRNSLRAGNVGRNSQRSSRPVRTKCPRIERLWSRRTVRDWWRISGYSRTSPYSRAAKTICLEVGSVIAEPDGTYKKEG